MWLWLSINPGTTVRPPRSRVRVHALRRWPDRGPTAVKRPFWMVTSRTVVPRASIVAILPFVIRRSRAPAHGSAALCAATRVDGSTHSAAANVAAPRAQSRAGSRRERWVIADRIVRALPCENTRHDEPRTCRPADRCRAHPGGWRAGTGAGAGQAAAARHARRRGGARRHLRLLPRRARRRAAEDDRQRQAAPR